ncbi:MAG: tetratricopeptide repeat protein [Nitratireductor sp.]|nr:tetratricopeptide repeat protein [Nitratireductor sp.]MCB1456223.1 tetratricopeptide repeat protein [Nitratireductor sp.]MCB1458693.1 tetratricopeptide repeat protein [Nitratireductor sp.]
MSDDSFIREVDEELRHDRARELWNRFGNLVIAAAILVVVGTGVFRYWQYRTEQQAAASGDVFLSAIELSKQGRQDDAISRLEELAKTGVGEYPALARMRLAGELIGRGDSAGALKAFDAISADQSVPEPLRSVATLRGGMLAVDSESYDEVRNRLSGLSVAGGPYRHLAREALGISALKAGNDQEALNWFQMIADDAGSSGNVRQRATIMLDLLASRGVKAAS